MSWRRARTKPAAPASHEMPRERLAWETPPLELLDNVTTRRAHKEHMMRKEMTVMAVWEEQEDKVCDHML